MNYCNLIERIKSMYDAGIPLNITAVKRRCPELLEAVYQARPLLGWKQMLQQAGISYESITVELEDTSVVMDTGNCCSLGFALPHWECGWSREYVIDRILEYKRLAYPIDRKTMKELDRPTVEHANKYFESWEHVLLEIGQQDYVVDSVKDVPVKSIARGVLGDFVAEVEAVKTELTSPASLTRETVLEKLTCRIESHVPVTGSALQDGLHADPDLFSSCVILFGDVRTALRAAMAQLENKSSITKTKVPSKVAGKDQPSLTSDRSRQSSFADKEHVISCLRARLCSGKSLTPRGMRGGPQRDWKLYQACCDCFGGLRPALDAAGIPHELGQKIKYAKPEDVIKKLQRRSEQGVPMSVSELRKGQHKDTGLHLACCNFFGGVREALIAAGLTAPSTRKYYVGKNDVINALRQRHENGQSIYSEDLKKESLKARRLQRACLQFFGTMKDAVVAARIPYRSAHTKTRFENAEDVMAALQKRQQDGLPINVPMLTKGEQADRTLINAIYRIFGGIDAAVDAAGCQKTKCAPRKVKKKYRNKDQVIKALHRRRDQGIRCSPFSSKQHKDVSLGLACRDFFGSWYNAADAAGIDYKTRLKYADKKAVIVGLRRRQEHGQLISCKSMCLGEDQEINLYKSALRLFGSLEDAAKGAGVVFSGKLKNPYCNAQDVYVALRKRHRNGLSVFSNQIRFGDDRDVSLFTACFKYCGNVRTAVETAGIVYPKIERKSGLSCEDVITELKSRVDIGLPVSVQELRKGDLRNPRLYAACLKHFGSLKAAHHAARIES